MELGAATSERMIPALLPQVSLGLCCYSFLICVMAQTPDRTPRSPVIRIPYTPLTIGVTTMARVLLNLRFQATWTQPSSLEASSHVLTQESPKRRVLEDPGQQPEQEETGADLGVTFRLNGSLLRSHNEAYRNYFFAEPPSPDPSIEQSSCLELPKPSFL